MKPVKLNLGCGKVIKKGWINIDKFDYVGVNKVLDLTNPLPYLDNSVDEILADNVLEHIRDWHLTVWPECKRVLKRGGIFTIIVPSGYDGNPLHVSVFLLNTIPYWISDHRDAMSLEVQPGVSFKLLKQEVTRWSSLPFKYHLHKYLAIPSSWLWGSRVRRFGKPHMIKWVLQKC